MENQQFYPHSQSSRQRRRTYIVIAIGLAILLFFIMHESGPSDKTAPATASAALTVESARATIADWPETIKASGPIAAWQEAIIGSEVSGQRLVEILADVGDKVKKGQVLARFNIDILRAEQAELLATWKQAAADSRRADSLKESGALSAKEVETLKSQAAVAKARLDAQSLQLRYATIIAPDDGTISSRTATLGSIGTAGSELYRMIVQDRIEWRGEINAQQLARVKSGQKVELLLPDDSSAQAIIRQVAPALDGTTRMATLYADITPESAARAGMYASGSIVLDVSPAVFVPAVSVVIRDGRSYVFTVQDDTTEGKVALQPVTTGRYQQQSVEIVTGLKEGTYVVTQGAGFLNDGDVVKVVKGAESAE